ncbi:MAG: hypothetical protein ACFNZW_08630 [Coriobacteriaceae bacterium]
MYNWIKECKTLGIVPQDGHSKNSYTDEHKCAAIDHYRGHSRYIALTYRRLSFPSKELLWKPQSIATMELKAKGALKAFW